MESSCAPTSTCFETSLIRVEMRLESLEVKKCVREVFINPLNLNFLELITFAVKFTHPGATRAKVKLQYRNLTTRDTWYRLDNDDDVKRAIESSSGKGLVISATVTMQAAGAPSLPARTSDEDEQTKADSRMANVLGNTTTVDEKNTPPVAVMPNNAADRTKELSRSANVLDCINQVDEQKKPPAAVMPSNQDERTKLVSNGAATVLHCSNRVDEKKPPTEVLSNHEALAIPTHTKMLAIERAIAAYPFRQFKESLGNWKLSKKRTQAKFHLSCRKGGAP